MGTKSRVLVFLLSIYLVSGTQNYGQDSNQRAAAAEDGGETTAMLDAMVQLMQGTPGQFDREFLASLTACWETLDPEAWVNILPGNPYFFSMGILRI